MEDIGTEAKGAWSTSRQSIFETRPPCTHVCDLKLAQPQLGFQILSVLFTRITRARTGDEGEEDRESSTGGGGECARGVWHLWAAAEEADAEAEAAGGDLRGAELPWEPIRLRERERDARVAQDVSRFHVQQEQVRYGQYGVLKPLAPSACEAGTTCQSEIERQPLSVARCPWRAAWRGSVFDPNLKESPNFWATPLCAN